MYQWANLVYKFTRSVWLKKQNNKHTQLETIIRWIFWSLGMCLIFGSAPTFTVEQDAQAE